MLLIQRKFSIESLFWIIEWILLSVIEKVIWHVFHRVSREQIRSNRLEHSHGLRVHSPNINKTFTLAIPSGAIFTATLSEFSFVFSAILVQEIFTEHNVKLWERILQQFLLFEAGFIAMRSPCEALVDAGDQTSVGRPVGWFARQIAFMNLDNPVARRREKFGRDITLIVNVRDDLQWGYTSARISRKRRIFLAKSDLWSDAVVISNKLSPQLTRLPNQSTCNRRAATELRTCATASRRLEKFDMK